MPSAYLGIDQSLTSPGFALVDEDGKYITSATVRIARGVVGGARLVQISKALWDFAAPFEILKAAREGYSVASVNRPFDLGTVAGVVDHEVFKYFETSPIVVPPTSLKKFATGSGSATKSQMLYAVTKRLGIALGDRDDEADACFLALFARSMATGITANLAERESTYRLQTPKPPRLKRTSTSGNI